ncbi:hypothetical protein ACFL6Z_12365 [Pseudomonadota bacterium]
MKKILLITICMLLTACGSDSETQKPLPPNEGTPISPPCTVDCGDGGDKNPGGGESPILPAPLPPVEGTPISPPCTVDCGDEGDKNPGEGESPIVPVMPAFTIEHSDDSYIAESTVLLSVQWERDYPADVEYQWTQVSGPAISITGNDKPEASFYVPTSGGAENIGIQLKITSEYENKITSVNIPVYAPLGLVDIGTVRLLDNDKKLTINGGHDGDLLFESSQDEILSTDSEGLLTPHAVGESQVTVTQLATDVYPELSSTITITVNKAIREPVDLPLISFYFGDSEQYLSLPVDDISDIEFEKPYVVALADLAAHDMTQAGSSLLLDIQGEGETTVVYHQSETDIYEATTYEQAIEVQHAVFSSQRYEYPIVPLSAESVQTTYKKGDKLNYKYSARIMSTREEGQQCSTYWTDEQDEIGYWIFKEYCVDPGEQIELPSGVFSAQIKDEDIDNQKIIWDTVPTYLPFTSKVLAANWNRCEWSYAEQNYIGYADNVNNYEGNQTCSFLYHQQPLEWKSWREDGEGRYSLSNYTFEPSTYQGMMEVWDNQLSEMVYLEVNYAQLTVERSNRNPDDTERTLELEVCDVWYNPEVGPVRVTCDNRAKDPTVYPRRSHPLLELRLEIESIREKREHDYLTCIECHDSSAAEMHMASNGYPGPEYMSCHVCHDDGKQYAVPHD